MADAKWWLTPNGKWSIKDGKWPVCESCPCGCGICNGQRITAFDVTLAGVQDMVECKPINLYRIEFLNGSTFNGTFRIPLLRSGLDFCHFQLRTDVIKINFYRHRHPDGPYDPDRPPCEGPVTSSEENLDLVIDSYLRNKVRSFYEDRDGDGQPEFFKDNFNYSVFAHMQGVIDEFGSGGGVGMFYGPPTEKTGDFCDYQGELSQASNYNEGSSNVARYGGTATIQPVYA